MPGLAPPCPACSSTSPSGWRASEQQWPTRILPWKPCAQRGLGDLLQRDRARRSSVSSAWKSRSSPSSMRAREHAVEQLLEVGHHVGDARRARRSAAATACASIVEPGVVAHAVDAEQATPPAARCGRASARASPRTPARRSPPAAATRIEMGAERLGAVRVGAAQREIHAPRDIVGRPARRAVRADGIRARP